MQTNDGIADRLREQRENLGFSQLSVAEKIGITRQSQGNYESGLRYPDAAYLASIATLGFDIGYIITGTRAAPPVVELTREEEALVDAYRKSSEEDKRAMRRMGDAFKNTANDAVKPAKKRA